MNGIGSSTISANLNTDVNNEKINPVKSNRNFQVKNSTNPDIEDNFGTYELKKMLVEGIISRSEYEMKMKRREEAANIAVDDDHSSLL